jgi:DNA-binding transcriptional ArsR family regulator
VELRGLEPLAFWMQTSGTALLAVERCSPARVRMPAQDSRSAHGLLYLAAVWAAVWQLDRCQPRLDTSMGGVPCPIQPSLYSTAMTVSVQVDLGTLARVGMALADPTRRRVLVHLIDGPGYPSEMAEDFGTSRANLSNHLTCLRECGLVTATAEGRRVRYELADERLADGLRILAALDLPGCCQ